MWRVSMAATVLVVLGATGLEAPAWAQACPPAYSACDNGGCCPSADECCPTAAEGCCTSYAPFCCGDGTCAVSPSACGADADAEAGAAVVVCPGYDTPCGGGCAPTGADCCDPQGHYCPAGSACTSATTCTIGDASATLAETVVPVQSASRILSPVADPGGGSGRSCALIEGELDGGAPVMPGCLMALAACARRRRRRRSEDGRPSPLADQGRARARAPEGDDVDATC